MESRKKCVFLVNNKDIFISFNQSRKKLHDALTHYLTEDFRQNICDTPMEKDEHLLAHFRCETTLPIYGRLEVLIDEAESKAQWVTDDAGKVYKVKVNVKTAITLLTFDIFNPQMKCIRKIDFKRRKDVKHADINSELVKEKKLPYLIKADKHRSYKASHEYVLGNDKQREEAALLSKRWYFTDKNQEERVEQFSIQHHFNTLADDYLIDYKEDSLESMTINSRPYYSEFIRWINQNELFKKVLLSPLAWYELNSCHPKQYLNYLFRATAIPTNHISLFYYSVFINQIFSGLNDALNGLWPTFFYSILMYDGYHHVFHSDQQDVATSLQLFLGTVNNANYLTSTWGSDRETEVNYFIVPIVALSLPIISGAWRAIRNYRVFSRSNTDLLNIESQPNHINQLGDILRWFSLWPSKFQSNLDRAIYSLQWNNKLDSDHKNALIRIVHDAVNNHFFVTKMQAIYALGEIANTYRQLGKELFAKSLKQKMHFDSIEKYASKELAYLLRTSVDTGNLAAAIYTSHILWQHGYKVSTFKQLLFSVKTFIVLSLIWYAKIRLVEMMYHKGAKFFYYLNNKKKCEEENKIFTYIDEWAQHVCEICPDWNDIYLGDISTSQQCLNGLLTNIQSPTEIIKKLDRVLMHPHFSDFNFSKQNISRWRDSEWENLLNKLAGTVTSLNTFDFSKENYNLPWLPSNKLINFAHFLNQVSVKSINLHNQNMGPDIADTFLSAFHASHTEMMDLSYNSLGERGAEATINWIRNTNGTLKEIKLAGNQLTDKDSRRIIRAISYQLSIASIDFSHNLIGQETIDLLGEVLLTHPFKTIHLSGNDFSTLDLTPLWRGLAHTIYLQNLYLDDSCLSDQHLADATPYLSNWTMRHLSLSGNQFSITGMDYLFQGLTNNQFVQEIYLDRNAITDEVLQVIGDTLPSMSVTVLSLNQNDFTSRGLMKLMPYLHQARQLQKFFIGGNKLGDEALIALVENILNRASNQTLPLILLDIQANNLSDKSGIVLMKALRYSNVTALILSDNQFGDETAEAFAQVLHDTVIQTFIAPYNFIGERGAQTIARALPYSLLSEINIAYNPLGNGIKLIAQQLITPIPYPNRDDQVELSIEEKRALYQAKPNTKLKTLMLAKTNMNNSMAREICRVLPQSGIPIEQFMATSNSEVTTVDLQNCRFSSSRAAHLRPSLIYKKLYQWAEAAEDNLVMALTQSNMIAVNQIHEHINLPDIATNIVPQQQLDMQAEMPVLLLPSHANGQHSTVSFTSMPLLFMLGGVIPVIHSIILLYVLYKLLSPLFTNIAEVSNHVRARAYQVTYKNVGFFGDSTPRSFTHREADAEPSHDYKKFTGQENMI